MPALPVLSGRKVVRVFEKLDWRIARQRGSHLVMVKEGESVTLDSRPPGSRQRHPPQPHPGGGHYRGRIRPAALISSPRLLLAETGRCEKGRISTPCKAVSSPAGRPRIAQRFNAGTIAPACSSPASDDRRSCDSRVSVVPVGTGSIDALPSPALKRWTILCRPAGLETAWQETEPRLIRSGASPSCRLLRGTPGQGTRPTKGLFCGRCRPGALTRRGDNRAIMRIAGRKPTPHHRRQ